MKGRVHKGVLAGVLGLAASLIAAPAALASGVTVTGGNTLRVTETGSEVNKIGVSYDAGTDLYTVVDASANLAPSGTCTAVNTRTATCPGMGIKTTSVDTDQQADTIAMGAGFPSTVTGSLDGGGGNDSVSGPGTVDGGSGDDTVFGSPLADN